MTQTRETYKQTLHFDLRHGHPATEYTLHVGSKRHVLKPHSHETFAQATKTNQALARLPIGHVTHYAEDIELPNDQPIMLIVTHPSAVPGAQLDSLALTSIHIPADSRRKALEHHLRHGHPTIHQPHPKLVLLASTQEPQSSAAIPPTQISSASISVPDLDVNMFAAGAAPAPAPPPAPQAVAITANEHPKAILDVHDLKTAHDTACSLLFHHIEMMNLDPDTAARVMHHIEYANGIDDLAVQILLQAKVHQRDPGRDNWVIETNFLDEDGNPLANEPRYEWSETTKKWMVGPMKASLRSVKNAPELQSTSTQAGCWTVQQGVAVAPPPQAPVAMQAMEEMTTMAMTMQAVAPTQYYWALNNLTPQHGLDNDHFNYDSTSSTLSIDFYNSWLRYLSAFVEFLRADGTAIKVPDRDGILSKKVFVRLIGAVNTILGIPLPATYQTVQVTMPEEATEARILLGGIGRSGGIEGQDGHYYGSWDSDVCTSGAIMTGIFNIGIPTLLLASGARAEERELDDLAKTASNTLLKLLGPLMAVRFGGPGAPPTEALLAFFANCAIKLALKKSPELAAWVVGKIVEAEAENAMLFVGWVALAINIGADIASLAETTAEIAQAPAAYELRITRAMDISWQLLPDPRSAATPGSTAGNTWPREADHYIITATYNDGSTPIQVKGSMATGQIGPIDILFSRVPAGGEVKLEACFYSSTDWLCGKASTEFMKAQPTDGSTLIVPTARIEERLIPLSADSKYHFLQKLIYNVDTAHHEWSDPKASSAPTATVKALDSSNIGRNLSELGNITYGERNGQLGYSWQASGLNIPLNGQPDIYPGLQFTFQSIDSRTDAKSGLPQSSLRTTPAGFGDQTMLVFERNGPADGTGFNFFVDPSNQQYHLRKVVVDGRGGQFNITPGQSLGRFNTAIDRCIYHPAGYAVGISTQTHKIQILKLSNQSYPDANAPLAELYSGNGTRAGLLTFPVAITASSDASILILEVGDATQTARIQAFDLHGNPVNKFTKATSPFFVLKTESQQVHYLDLDVESKGYIYVLKYLGAGANVSDYLLDIYQPDGSFLVQTTGIAAGRMVVDQWRTVYTLNFEIIARPDNGPTEPSVSIWLPPTPQGGDNS
jgi:hypothetical protein